MPHRLKHWHTEAVHVTEVARTYFLLARDQTKNSAPVSSNISHIEIEGHLYSEKFGGTLVPNPNKKKGKPLVAG
jgi:hypothetical protein